MEINRRSSGCALTADAKEPAAQRMIAANAPLLAAAGWAWREVDLDRADNLLKQAIAIEQKRPGAAQGEMNFAFAWLFERAMAQQHFEDAAAVLRQQARHSDSDDESAPVAVSQLMALHAEHGPLQHFADDLRADQRWLADPRVVYSIARMARRWEHPVAGTLLDALAMALSGNSEEEHSDVGGFLAEQGWDTAAERELHLAIWLSDGPTANEYFQLAHRFGTE